MELQEFIEDLQRVLVENPNTEVVGELNVGGRNLIVSLRYKPLHALRGGDGRRISEKLRNAAGELESTNPKMFERG